MNHLPMTGHRDSTVFRCDGSTQHGYFNSRQNNHRVGEAPFSSASLWPPRRTVIRPGRARPQYSITLGPALTVSTPGLTGVKEGLPLPLLASDTLLI